MTKTSIVVATIFTIISLFGIANASFSIPEDAFRVNWLNEAREQAEADGWYLAFLFSDEETTCSFGTNASLDIIRELEKTCIIVYIKADSDDLDKCPELVKNAISSGKAGRMLPIAVVADPKIERIVDIIPYKKSEEHLALLAQATENIANDASGETSDVMGKSGFFSYLKYIIGLFAILIFFYFKKR